MNCLHIGNLNNYAYNNVKYLRRRGFDADVLIRRNSQLGTNPITEDPEIADNAPEWIVYWDRKYLGSKLNLFNIARRYDFLHTYAGSTIYAPFIFKPYVAHSTGTDLRELVFDHNFTGLGLKHGYNKAKTLLFSLPEQVESIEKLGIKNWHFIPQGVDIDKYTPRTKKADGKFRIFILSKWTWRFKGTDKFIRAFAKVLKKKGKEADNVELVCVDFGADAERTKRLVKKLGIDDNVVFVKRMTRNELIEFYSKVDLVVDQFVVGSYGLGTVEAMACAKPIMMYINEKYFYRFYPKPHPLINAFTIEDIYKQLMDVVGDTKKCKKIGEKSREWVMKNHHWKKIADNMIKIYEKSI
jgi:glycosyltransferase involved in cell wall biosynthesis